MGGDSNASMAAAMFGSGLALGGALFYIGALSGRASRSSSRDAVVKHSRRSNSQREESLDESDSSEEEQRPTRRERRQRRRFAMLPTRRQAMRGAAQCDCCQAPRVPPPPPPLSLVQEPAVDEKPAEDERCLAFQVGFSMEEARNMAEARHEEAMNRMPLDVLSDLQRGNARFWMGMASRPEKSAFERRALISKQYPHTAILGCSDSRVPIEIVFDQGLGDIFTVRVAGNCLDTATTASMQYAVHHLKVKVLIVMGHEGCGAVKAAQLPQTAIDNEPEELGTLLQGIKVSLEGADHARVQDVKAADREAVTRNVRAQVDALAQDERIMTKIRSGELMMLGAFYEISSGIVDFFHEVSGDDLEESGLDMKRAPSHGVLTRRYPLEKAEKAEA